MDRTNAAGHVNHLFVAEDTATNTPPTEITAQDLNAHQEELINIILAAALVPSAANNAQVLAALRSAGVFQTPAQFDNTTKVATTAFLKLFGMQSSGIVTVTTSAAIALSSVGGTVVLSSATAIAPTIPAANTVPNGGRIEFLNTNAGIATLTRIGTDAFVVNSATVTAIPLSNGDTLTLESNGVNGWNAVAGSAQLGWSGAFGASLASSGYQKLPSGFIKQWGTTPAIPSGGSMPITFPIAFPIAAHAITFGLVTGGVLGTSYSVGASLASLTGTTVYAYSPAASASYYYEVIGK